MEDSKNFCVKIVDNDKMNVKFKCTATNPEEQKSCLFYKILKLQYPHLVKTYGDSQWCAYNHDISRNGDLTEECFCEQAHRGCKINFFSARKTSSSNESFSKNKKKNKSNKPKRGVEYEPDSF